MCGDSYGRYKKLNEINCNNNCTGNSSQKCGGYWINSVYEITGFDPKTNVKEFEKYMSTSLNNKISEEYNIRYDNVYNFRNTARIYCQFIINSISIIPSLICCLIYFKLAFKRNFHHSLYKYCFLRSVCEQGYFLTFAESFFIIMVLKQASLYFLIM